MPTNKKNSIEQKKTPSKKLQPAFSDNAIPKFFQKNWVIILILFVLIFIFFGPGIFGNGFNASDSVASISFREYLKQAKQDGSFPLWIPYIFSGMPSFAALLVTGERIWDFTSKIYFGFIEQFQNLFGNDEARVAIHYVIFAIGMYFLMREKKHNELVSLFTSLAAVFSTGAVVWIMIGHNTKPVVFSMYPWIFFFMEKLIKKFSLLYAVLTVIAVHIMLEATHVQMIFYGVLAFGIYLIYELISRFISKNEPLSVLRPGIILALAFGFSFLLSADRYLSIQEYTPYSTRGSGALEKTESSKQTKDGGNDYDYATQWSFSPGETFTFLIPNYYGFGKLSYSGPETGGKEMKIPTYWGQKPFEDAAPYMGIFIFFFAILGAIANRKDVFVQALIFISIFAWILSFGYTLPVLYNFFYYNVPMFNKFRAPSMALVLVNFAFPILAGYGLNSLINWNKEQSQQGKKTTQIFLYISLAFLVLGFAFTTMFKDAYYQAMASSQSLRLPENFRDFIWSNMINDWYINGFILVIAFYLSYLFVSRKIKFAYFIYPLFILLIFDLWRVGYRPMDIPEEKLSLQVFPKDDAFDYVKKDKEIFRVADFASASPNVSAHYLLQNVNGYHSAKLRVYQDMLDFTSQGNTSNVMSPFMWNLLNVKYILAKEDMKVPPIYTSQRTGTRVYYNASYLPRAFFVDSSEIKTPKEILTSLKNADFDPKKVVFFEKDEKLKFEKPNENNFVNIRQYKNEYISMDVNATGSNLLVLSEIYYPDWKAYLDGKEIEIYKADYILRAVLIPNGKHKLELKFESKPFNTGKNLSLAANILLTVLLVLSLFYQWKNRKNDKDEV